VLYFVQDHLGSTNALTDATGNVISSVTYDSFGNSTGNLATRYQYTGREKDADTGLYFYRNRWYDSNLGRFLSEDPIGLSGGINQFGYVDGNPTNFSDPMGLEKSWWSQQADSMDENIAYAHEYWRPKEDGDPDWVVNGVNNSIATIAYGVSDMFRIGEGTYCAFAAKDENIWGRLAYVTMDIGRAAGIAGTILGITAPRLSSTPSWGTRPLFGRNNRVNPNQYPPPSQLKNGRLANGEHPVTRVPFDSDGFPDFSRHLYGGGTNNVTITPTGSRGGDFAAANRAAGYQSTPRGYTWHHHQQYGRMQLVDSTIHHQTGHTGGFSLW
jgi:RHS repeat-associated protein